MRGGMRVLNNEYGLGTFLATISVIQQIAADFGEMYMEFASVTQFAGVLAGLANMLNMPTDLLSLKRMNRQRRHRTRMYRQQAIEANRISSKPSIGNGQPATDAIPIKLEQLSFTHSDGHEVFSDVDLQVNQGSLVAVHGRVGSGRRTLMELLGNMIFPTKGSLFVPMHL